MDKPTVRKYGSRAILMEWEALISPTVHKQVVKAAELLKRNHSDWVLEVVTSYHSLVIFIKENIELKRHIDICQDLTISINKELDNSPIWQVPVCYDSSFGYDLDVISEVQNLPAKSIIKLHSDVPYRIYGMGFLPGFLYLGGLDKRIHTPRKSAVNQFVPKGSVAIGGEQTGIYPQKSPGGWNIIGRTPIELFNAELDTPTPFSIGDSIRFVPVNLDEFSDIQSEVDKGNYELKFILQ